MGSLAAGETRPLFFRRPALPYPDRVDIGDLARMAPRATVVIGTGGVPC